VLGLVLALGLAFRLIIAYAYPGTGFEVDLVSFRSWAANLAAEGLHGFYERDFFHDYTPGYLYVLYAVGLAGQALGGIGDLIKIPPIVADVVLGWLVWSMAIELGAGRRAALIGAALVVVNPVTWFDSVTWGQVDSFGVVFMLLGIRELWRDHPERAAILTVVAALIKPQLGILIPIVAVVTIRRALWPEATDGVSGSARVERSTGTRADDSLIGRLRAWERRTDRPIRIVTTGLAGLATAFALSAPFGLSVVEVDATGVHSGLVEQVFKTAGGYPYVSVNAYNPWALVQLDGTGIAANSVWLCDVVITNPVPGGPQCPTAFTIGPLPAVLVGAALMATALVAVCGVIALRPHRVTILLGVTVLAIAFFVLPTRVHERYLFPFFALGAVLAGFSRRWLACYVVLSAATFLNMYAVLTTLYPGNPGIVDWLGIGTWIRSSTGVTTIALGNIVAAAWAFIQLRPSAIAALQKALVSSEREPEVVRVIAPEQAPSPPVAAARSAVRVTPGQASDVTVPDASAPAAVELPHWSERPSFAEVGLVEWLRSRLNERPVRADRSRALHGEPTGRLDRLDLWFVVVLVVAILGLRIFRLAEPYQMHFDEVYHARTATEFLQAWRYGISHDIYEWTHPHLAKYAMAGGLIAWGDDRVSAMSELGVPVRDAIVEPRRDDPALLNGRAGDRLHVATGSEVRSYDLLTREPVFSSAVPGATALAIDSVGGRLFVGTTEGNLLTLDLYALDGIRKVGNADLVTPPQAFGSVDGAIRMLYASDDGATLFVATGDGRLVTLDAASAEPLAEVELAGIAGFAPAGSGPAVTATPGSVEDPSAAAATLADLLGGEAATYEARLASDAEPAIIAGIDAVDDRANIDAAIADGRLAGLAIEDVPRVAVATDEGVVFVASASGEVLSTTRLDGGAHGLALVTNVDDPKLYVSTGGTTEGARGEVAVIVVGGDEAKDGPRFQRTLPLPGPGSRVAYDDASQMVHVLGAAPDGGGSTIYVIETHANAVFADARLPIEPTAWAVDVAKPYPSADRQQILVFGSDGTAASVETGKHAFAWRLPGVAAGALMAGLLYLLARILFRRRQIGMLVGLMALVDGMLFVQSRIGMNDAYVGLGIVAAYTIFAAIWTGAWRSRWAFWVAMPAMGIALGVALAAKWVALYAIAAMLLLVLIRSALGRFVVITGLIAATAILGHLALAVPEGTGLGNLPFVAIMVGLTAIAVVVNVLHPVAWSDDEARFAVGGPAVLGAVVALAAVAAGKASAELIIGPVAVTPLQVAAALASLGLAAYAAFVVAGRLGFGPLAPPPAPTDAAALLPPPAPPPSESWLRPGALLGLPIGWMAIWLLLVPVAIYVASYIPWALIEGHRITDSWPPGHQGQTLIDLTRQMYEYHNNLTAGHAASSPWWAWPFDLKPVWFYQEGLAGSTTAAIYDAGNLVIWWLGVPALAFAAWQAYARRSLALALVCIGFAFQWLTWARIDRAAFQYHYYTSLPFVIMALAYFAAEIWHGASRRTWLLARLAAAAAIVGPALLWLFERPLCGFVGVERAVPNSQACPPVIPEFVLTAQTLALGVVVCAAVLVFLRQLASLDRAAPDAGQLRQLGPLAVTAAAALVGLAIVRLVPATPIFTQAAIPVEPVAVLLGLPLALLALFVATARDARRFVVGMLVAIVGWFLVVYPNIAALPLPSVVANAYQGILPTYLYAFQFPSNRAAASVPTSLIGPVPAILGAALVLLCIVLAYSAWVWRIALAEKAADEPEPATGLARGSPGG
jgi:hypothetical protein